MKTYPGFVYILSNPVFKDDIFKIGHTTRSPSDRAWEIYQNATGVPAKFEVAYARRVANCEQAEERIHELLKEVRINEYREFFRVSLFQAKEVFEEVCEQVDLECNEAAELSQKAVIDRIGTRESPKSSINSNATQSRVIAQEVARIRNDNDFKRAALLTQSGVASTSQRGKRSLWFVCLMTGLLLLGLFLYMKFIALPIAGALGGFVGDLFFISAPVIYLSVLGKVFALDKQIMKGRSQE